MKPRFITFKYKDGSTFTQQWDEMYDGEWKHSPDCYEVIYVLDKPNPLYEEYD